MLLKPLQESAENMVSEAALRDLCFDRAAAAMLDSTLQTAT